MGYCISLTDSDFRIPASKKAEALAAMKKMDPSVKGRGFWDNKRQWSWVDQEDIERAQSLEEAMTQWRYCPQIDVEGNIRRIDFEGEKIGQEDELFAVLAPFVEDGSFIEMQGEDGAMWRWVFRDGTVKMVEPKIEWGD
jgi:hypothetical protein